MSVVDKINRNKLKAGKLTNLETIPKTAESKKKGTHIFKIKRAAIKKGLNTVVKR